VLLDLDGTLVDTAQLWQRAYQDWATEVGVTLPSGWWAGVVGTGLLHSVAALAPHRTPAQHAQDAEAVVATAAALLRADDAAPVTWRAGARELVAALDAAGVATAVVTTSPRILLDAVVERLGVEVLVTVAGDEVSRSKPDPEGYLTAATELEVAVADCVVVEDSPVGVAAAEAAGMRVLAVPSGSAVPAAPTRRVVASLAGVDLGVLAGLPAPAAPRPT
jgi:HAD superfamily hydrolase (TIGR01509 family)